MKFSNQKILALAVILMFTAQLALAQVQCALKKCRDDKQCLLYEDPLNPNGNATCIQKCKGTSVTGVGRCISGWTNTQQCKKIDCTSDKECQRYKDPRSPNAQACQKCYIKPRRTKGECYSPY